MPTGALIGGLGLAGSLGSALIGSSATQKASQQQVQQEQAALAAQVAAQNQATQTLAPYNDVGTGAAHQLANLYGISYAPQGTGQASIGAGGVLTPANSNAAIGSAGGQGVMNASLANFTNTPDYQFAFQQGNRALDASLAANGQYFSGAQLQASQQFGQGLASQQYGNYYNRLLSLAQLGAGTGTSSAANTLNAANSQASTLGQIGASQASGTIGSANSLAGGLSGIGSNITGSLLASKLYGNNSSLSAYNTANNYAATYSQPQMQQPYDVAA